MKLDMKVFEDGENSKLYVADFSLSPLIISVSIRTFPSPDDPGAVGVAKFRSLTGIALPSISGAPLALAQFDFKHFFAEPDAAAAVFQSHYMKGVWIEVAKVLGSIDAFGNPVVLLSRIREGFSDFVKAPLSGLRQNPMAFTKGLAVGTMSLLSNTGGGITVFAGKITGSLSDKLAVLTLDQDYIRRRRGTEVRGVTDGLKKGALQFGRGIFEGITGVVVAPIKGGAKSGVSGFVKGVGKGIVGAAVKPVTGLLDFASQTSQGFQSKQQLAEIPRIRPPRYIEDSKLTTYSRKKAEGEQLFSQLKTYNLEELRENDRKPQEVEHLVEHHLIERKKFDPATKKMRSLKTVILITNKRVVFLVESASMQDQGNVLEGIVVSAQLATKYVVQIVGNDFAVDYVCYLSSITLVYMQDEKVIIQVSQKKKRNVVNKMEGSLRAKGHNLCARSHRQLDMQALGPVIMSTKLSFIEWVDRTFTTLVRKHTPIFLFHRAQAESINQAYVRPED